MGQVKFTFRENQAQFIGRYRAFGFKDKSAMVRAAVDHFQMEMERENLKKSAALYAEIYDQDRDLQGLTDSALFGWPE